MPIITMQNVKDYPDFPFRQFGVYFFKPDEYPSDKHYHDCDEAWLVLSGKARVLSEGKEYVVSAGDVVWTRMGDEHQLLEIIEPPYGVAWLENALRGRKRPGHLYTEGNAP
jgi:hypothetical protein